MAVMREGVHRQPALGLALQIALRHDASRGAVGGAHAVAEHDDDVLGRPALEVDIDDLEMAGRCGGLTVALRRLGGQGMQAGRQFRIAAIGHHGRACRQARDESGGHNAGVGGIPSRGIDTGHGLAVDLEGDRRHGGVGIGAHGGLQVEFLPGQEAGERRSAFDDRIAGWRQAGNRRCRKYRHAAESKRNRCGEPSMTDTNSAHGEGPPGIFSG